MSNPDLSEQLVALVEDAGASIVRIRAGTRTSTPGASAMVTAAGDIAVTSSRALRHEDDLRVVLDDFEVDAELVGRDPGLDLAVVRFDPAGFEQAPRPAKWRTDAPRVGELALAIARPGHTLRAALGLVGIVGGSFRTAGGARLDRYIELDRMLPRGFSGAAILDIRGNISGLATRGLVRGATLVLERDVVDDCVAELIAHGKVRRGYLGIGVHPARLPDPLARQHGRRQALTVIGLEDGGPAARGGVLVGDVFLSVEGDAIDTPLALRAALLDRADQPVHLRLLRAGQLQDLTVTVGARR